jgi:uncharacterized membrane protein YcaP (DUF421 family)
MELHAIALRVFLTYACLMLLIRAAGRRTVAEATPHDLVVALILGDLIDNAIWNEVTISQFLVAAGSIIVLEIVSGELGMRHPRIHTLLCPSPRRLMKDGKPIRSALRRERLTESDLDHMLRRWGIEREEWWRVRDAWLESDGRLAVHEQPDEAPLRRVDIQRASG